MAKKKEKTYTTTTADMIEGQPMSREAFKNLDVVTCMTWVKYNHPEIRKQFHSIISEPQEVAKVLPGSKKTVKVMQDGKPVMETYKKRNGTTAERQKTEVVPYEKGEKRDLNPFQQKTWLCQKYGMLPEAKTAKGTIKDNFDEIWDSL